MNTFLNRTKIQVAILAAGLLMLSGSGFAVTHLQVASANNHVTLVAGTVETGKGPCKNTLSFEDRAFFRILPTGEISATPFELSAKLKQRLVITDVEWSAYGGPLSTNHLTAGYTLRLSIFVLVNSGSDFATPVFISRGIDITSDNASGRLGSSEQLTSGFVVAPGAIICPTVSQEDSYGSASSYLDRIVLRGYLTK